MLHSLHSFTFFIKERGVLYILLEYFYILNNFSGIYISIKLFKVKKKNCPEISHDGYTKYSNCMHFFGDINNATKKPFLPTMTYHKNGHIQEQWLRLFQNRLK